MTWSTNVMVLSYAKGYKLPDEEVKSPKEYQIMVTNIVRLFREGAIGDN